MIKYNGPEDLVRKSIPCKPILVRTGKRWEQYYELLESAAYTIQGRTLEFPVGWKWNGASIPRVAQLSVGTRFEPAHLWASFHHDRAYEVGFVRGITQKMADIEYRATLKAAHKSWYTGWKEYRALRMFGWMNYTKGEK